ncbi:hypothetical protein KCU67_g8192, partial [Aureobasidium melanogenum]
FDYLLDAQCINFDTNTVGDGNRDCENTGAVNSSDSVTITGISGTGCIVTFYEGDDCNEDDDQQDSESFDEHEECVELGFWLQIYDVTGCD